MSIKERVISWLQTMPETVTWEDTLEYIRLQAAIDEAEAQIARGEGVPHDDAKRQIQECLQKLSGRRTA